MIEHDQIVSDIRTSAEEVFSTMLSTELRFAESYCDKGPSHPLDGVICLIGMAGQWTGTGTISCSAEFACRIASQMLMAEYAVVDGDVLDAVAEIANMILGNVKTALEKSLGAMGMSIPTAIFGKNFLAKSFGDETWSVVVFDCDGQRFEVKLFLKRSTGAPGPGSAKGCATVCLRA
ncbi:MAG TPA: chemotaxis protein CheX [Bryobacteraceae bacterium]|jgi:chemotaxis protein CheX|nr:chemotaxis protein CheX [Bryobacteraceae bacterium]